MKTADISEVKQEQSIFTDLWNIFKKYYHATTDEEWQQFVDETDNLYKTKYKDTEHESMFRDILTDITNQLERKHRKERNKWVKQSE